jgi:signal transduction histidine kinase
VSRALVPLFAALIGLAGSLGATLFLHRAADTALQRILEERLRGAGEAAAEWVARAPPDEGTLRAVMRASRLEGAYVLSPGLEVVADASGAALHTADLLRTDPARARRALAGEQTIAFSYDVAGLPIATGYFPVRSGDGSVRAVLALEGGQEFAGARAGLRRALWAGVGLSTLGAVALALAALGWSRTEAQRRASAERAVRGDALARMASMVAHEVRNPLGVIRGAVDLVRARSGAALAARDDEALRDVLGEVERLRRLTEDFLDLSREPRLESASLDLGALAEEAVQGSARAHGLEVAIDVPHLPVDGDPVRLRQVFVNLLANAAQAGARRIDVRGAAQDGTASVEVRDDGPGVAPELAERIFDPFTSGRRDGTGLGLAVSRRIVERHGGELRLVADAGPGATFELRIPLSRA